jgi:hypothetical protein
MSLIWKPGCVSVLKARLCLCPQGLTTSLCHSLAVFITLCQCPGGHMLALWSTDDELTMAGDWLADCFICLTWRSYACPTDVLPTVLDD